MSFDAARVESFHDKETSTFTHVVFDEDGSHAAIIDPVLGFDPVRARTATCCSSSEVLPRGSHA